MQIRPFAVVATHLANLLGYWGSDVINVLYGTDDYVAGAELMGVSVRHVRKEELQALARADVVAAVSPQLAQRWRGLGANPVLIPNGCKLAADLRAQAVPPEVRGLAPPVVGLIGQLSARIDLNILDAIAGAGYSLLIVGPLDPRWEQRRFKELIRRSHVHYAGPVQAEAVPSYLAAIDVGITPYRDTPFNRASFPLKTLEYLGAGVPVVSADLPTARWLRSDFVGEEHNGTGVDQILALARSQDEFADAIRRIVTRERYPAGVDAPGRHGTDQIRAEQCVAFAARHSWLRRADAFASAIGLQ